MKASEGLGWLDEMRHDTDGVGHRPRLLKEVPVGRRRKRKRKRKKTPRAVDGGKMVA